jgi:hypothetical protein
MTQNGWRFIAISFPLFENGRVRFFLLNALNNWLEHRWGSVPFDGRRQLTHMLMTWTRNNIGLVSENVGVIRSKVCICVVCLS